MITTQEIHWVPVSVGVLALAVSLIGGLYTLIQIQDRGTQRRRQQSELVTVVTANSETAEPTSGLDADAVIVTNASSETIVGVLTGITIGDGYSWAQDTYEAFEGQMPPCQVVVENLPPGKWLVTGLEGWAGMSKRPHPVIAFTDRNQRHWFKDGKGKLRPVKRSAILWHDVYVPISYTKATRLH